MNNKKEMNPYNFVPVKPELAETFRPVWHDTRMTDSEEKLYSGEMRCTMTTLTPLLAGNYQYRLEEAKSWGKDLISKGYSKEKVVIEPLRLCSDGQPVVISGSAIKGMLRNAVAALASAPMERVSERTYSYRPNTVIPEKADIQILPAVPVKIKENGDVVVKVLDDLSDVYFVTRAAEDAPHLEDACENKRDFNIPLDYGIFKNQFRRGRPQDSENKSYRVFRYFGGLDGQGLLAEGKVKTCQYVLVSKSKETWNKGNETTITAQLWDHFRSHTLDHLKNSQTGHISSRHPDLQEKNTSQIVQAIEDLQNYFNNEAGNEKLLDQVLVFVEVQNDNKKDNKKVITLGHHLRYRWRYQDTVLFQNIDRERIPRKEVIPLAKEQKAPAELELSLARLLFGFVAEDDENGEPCRHNLGDKRPALAGRIAINAAIEELTPNEKGDQDRFLNHHQNCLVFLKVLGSPRPSAVEHYLTQNTQSLQERNDQGTLCTYGDDHNDPSCGDLRGRKFYYHQPQAAHKKECYTQNPQELVIHGRQCAIGRFISRPNRQFRFTIRFRNLRAYELKLLKFVIELDVSQIESIAGLSEQKPLQRYVEVTCQDKGEVEPSFAHKLGHGRPLGLGSVQLRIDGLLYLDHHGNIVEDIEDPTFQPDFVNKDSLQNWARDIYFPWLRMHQYAGMEKYEFGYREGNQGCKSPTINFHTEVRNEHLKGRKEKKKSGDRTPAKNERCLPDPCDDIPSQET